MKEKDLVRILSQDLSQGTETFRNRLLGRCLEVLDSENAIRELSDEDLTMLSAAGIQFGIHFDDRTHPLR